MKNIMLMSDGYKLAHHRMYPEGTKLVFSNFTPRSSKHAPKGTVKNGVIVMGVKKMLTDLHNNFSEFFNNPFDESVQEMLNNYLNTEYDLTHFRKLHKLGYLPIEIRAMKEGSFCPIGVPFLTIYNTNSDFYWLPNFLETYISANLWKSVTCATIVSGLLSLGFLIYNSLYGILLSFNHFSVASFPPLSEFLPLKITTFSYLDIISNTT